VSLVVFKDLMGALAVVMAVIAYGIYVWQTLRGRIRCRG
jgi:cytochrome bd-type quinol oxidase subunit 2